MNPITSSDNSAKLELNAYVPPKDWKDITDGEKIERMREVIKQLSSNLARSQSDIHYLRENFKKHEHSDKGITVPFNEYNNTLNGIGVLGTATNGGFF